MYDIVKSSTTRVLMFLMVDSTDHVTGKTGLTPTVTLSKNGAAFGSPAGAVSEVANGWYKVAGNATDSNTEGPLALHATATGADPTDTIYNVVDPATETYGAKTTSIVANAITATAINADAITAAKVANGAIDAATFAAGAIDAAALATDAANEIADALLDRAAGVETGLTPRQVFRLFAAALLGKCSGLATTTAVFRDTGDSKDRITATVDANGNRTAVTLDGT